MNIMAKKQEVRPIQFLYSFDEGSAKVELARMVRAARERAGYTQRQLADRAMTTQAVIARLELGSDSRMPSLTLIARLLHAAGASLQLAARFDTDEGGDLIA
jgi:transcriptional regulator with XRE-family HTH domain